MNAEVLRIITIITRLLNMTHSPTMTLSDWFSSSSSSSSSNTTLEYPAILLMDGGVSTHLEQLIAPQTSFSHRELWSSSLLLTQEGRNTTQQGHADWLVAGSNIVTTVTYQCHFGLASGSSSRSTVVDTRVADDRDTHDSTSESGMVVSKDTMSEMIRQGVHLARKAIEEHMLSSPSNDRLECPFYVVASTGPYGAAMADGSEYTGRYPPHVDEEALLTFHRQKAAALWGCRPDGLAVETVPNLQEVQVVCQVLQELSHQDRDKAQQQLQPRNCSCWISLACQDGTRLNDGNLLQDALDSIESVDPYNECVSAVGVNCCDSVHIASLVNILAQHVISTSQNKRCPRGIVLYPNSGESWDATNEVWKDGTGADDTPFADRIFEAIDIIRTVRDNHSQKGKVAVPMPKVIVGGCCRTSEKTIALLRKRIDALCEKSMM